MQQANATIKQRELPKINQIKSLFDIWYVAGGSEKDQLNYWKQHEWDDSLGDFGAGAVKQL